MLRTIGLACAGALLALAGVLVPDDAMAQSHRRCGNCGTVVDVDQVWIEDKHVGSGALIGALVGAAVGNQVGSGSGRKAATVAGALAGGAVGHKVQKNRRGDVRGYRIEVRMDSGRYRVFEQVEDYRVYRGDRVVVRGNHVEPYRR